MRNHSQPQPLSSRLPSRLAIVAIASLAAAATLGCVGFSTTSSPASPAAGLLLQGKAMGGQQPLSGARVYLFAAGATGYASASVSLLNTALPAVSTDASSNGYVLTDSAGAFSITGDWTCAHANDQVYLLVTGGNPGLAAGTNNTAIVLMDALGTCNTISSSTYIVINEVSTVTAVTALQQFMTDGTHVGASGTNAAGLATALATAASMADINAASARTLTVAGNGKVPQAKLHSLANILATCVNTASGASSACTTLFAAAKPSSGPAPTNSLAAALDIALNPANNVASLYAIPTPTPPFQPALSAAPLDWIMGITYTLGGTPLPGFLAIDATGNVWISSQGALKAPSALDSIIKISPVGALLNGTGYTAGGVHFPEGMAIDDSGNVWIANTSNSVIKLSNAGVLASGFPAIGGNFPQDIAIDISGNAWVSNSQGSDVMKIAPNGTLVGGITSTGFSSAQGIAIDASGHIWVAGAGSNSILELDSSAAVLSGSGAGFTGGGLNAPTGLAIDAQGHVWLSNSNFGASSIPASISEFNNSGTAISGSSGYGANTSGFQNILAIDGANTVWSVSCGPNCIGKGVDNVIHLAGDGTVLSPAAGFQNTDFNTPQAVAIDASGNLWVANSAGQANSTPGTITELVGIAAPVKTPLQSALKAGLLGQRP